MNNERYEKFVVFIHVRNFKEDASVNKRRREERKRERMVEMKGGVSTGGKERDSNFLSSFLEISPRRA